LINPADPDAASNLIRDETGECIRTAVLTQEKIIIFS
jgi:hypothetical protein